MTALVAGVVQTRGNLGHMSTGNTANPITYQFGGV